MDGQAFVAYLEKALIPILPPHSPVPNVPTISSAPERHQHKRRMLQRIAIAIRLRRAPLVSGPTTAFAVL